MGMRMRGDGSWWVGVIVVGLVTTTGLPFAAARLSYHEGIVVQGAREMAAAGDWVTPTIGGAPWLEKPPLAHWAVGGICAGAGSFAEWVARRPSGLAALLLGLAVGALAAPRFGDRIALWAGCIQMTTLWTITRGRLAEADILLAALIAWCFLALDRIRLHLQLCSKSREIDVWRWVFFVALGMTGLAKGVGFGAVLVLGAATATAVWDRDSRLARTLLGYAPGWATALLIQLAWPCSVLVRYPEAWELWTHHVTDRLGTQTTDFTGRTLPQCALIVAGQLLPWLPFAIVGLAGNWAKARSPLGRGTTDRLLWCWIIVPSALLSCATVKNPHYFLHALPPLSVFAALGLQQATISARVPLGMRTLMGRIPKRRDCLAGFLILACVQAVLFDAAAWSGEGRGREWSFYARASAAASEAPIVVVYGDWDRLPYRTPFGPVPHDWAVRLYYLNRPAHWVNVALSDGSSIPPTPINRDLNVIGRQRDLPAFLALLRNQEPTTATPVLESPPQRWDRIFTLFHIAPHVALARTPPTDPDVQRARYALPLKDEAQELRKTEINPDIRETIPNGMP